ncbi:hypothetical protein E2C01_069859 [Portunus trituberculatus]|uniref:Uncharacterized protein n=1 Tax=Portunus trituberculatus TaxID=210409 RepID=A0A5B7HR61_PORTR|nr:hypothetical protein [Portunus trituberculatus]
MGLHAAPHALLCHTPRRDHARPKTGRMTDACHTHAGNNCWSVLGTMLRTLTVMIAAAAAARGLVHTSATTVTPAVSDIMRHWCGVHVWPKPRQSEKHVTSKCGRVRLSKHLQNETTPSIISLV